MTTFRVDGVGVALGSSLLAAAIQLALLPGPAHACGGLFCDASQPVNQAAERILFVRNADDTITAAIEIKYEGPPQRFSWVLPVPGEPTVAVSSTAAFDRLQAATNPQYRLQARFEDCDSNFDSARGGGGAAGPDSDEGGAVTVLARGSVGPYDYEVIRVDDSADDKAQAAVDWLMANGYDLFDNGPELLRPYLENGLNLIGFRLDNDRDTGAIRPIVITYASDNPFIPIRPTAVAANEDMGVLVWVVGESRAIPENYKALELNDALINWWNPGSNYDAVVSAAADEAGGQGFVTELAQPSETLEAVIIGEGELAGWRQAQQAMTDPVDLFLAAAERFGSWDGFREAVADFATLPSDFPLDDFLDCPSCYPPPSSLQLDVAGFVEALQLNVIDPMLDTQALLTSRPYVTRLYTTMSAEEMTMDPLFDFNADLPDVSNVHTADAYVRCDDAYRVSLPSGGTLYGRNQGIWPSDELDAAELPAARSISQLTKSGDGEVLRDNAGTIDEALADTPSALAYGEDCGCSAPGRRRTGAAAVPLLCVLALASCRGLRRR